ASQRRRRGPGHLRRGLRHRHQGGQAEVPRVEPQDCRDGGRPESGCARCGMEECRSDVRVGREVALSTATRCVSPPNRSARRTRSLSAIGDAYGGGPPSTPRRTSPASRSLARLTLARHASNGSSARHTALRQLRGKLLLLSVARASVPSAAPWRPQNNLRVLRASAAKTLRRLCGCAANTLCVLPVSVAIVLSISAAPRLRGARESNPLHAAIDVASLDDAVAEDQSRAAQLPPRVRRA